MTAKSDYGCSSRIGGPESFGHGMERVIAILKAVLDLAVLLSCA